MILARDTLGDRTMTNFPADILNELRDVREVAIRTEKHPESAVVIWVVVAGAEVLVRSWRGTKGRWYRDLAAGGPAFLEFASRRLAVQAIPASDPTAVAQASSEFLRKYGPGPYAEAMVKPEIRPTTLRLEPR
jgi:hypothetical protein